MPEDNNASAANKISVAPIASNGGVYAPRKISGTAKNKINKLKENHGTLTQIQAFDTNSSVLAVKTPVSILQELLSRRGITPNYELVQIEGAIHEPTFRYRVSFSDKEIPLTAMGSGRSKKEAKHAAAKALIDKLTGVTVTDRSFFLNESQLGGNAQLE